MPLDLKVQLDIIYISNYLKLYKYKKDAHSLGNILGGYLSSRPYFTAISKKKVHVQIFCPTLLPICSP